MFLVSSLLKVYVIRKNGALSKLPENSIICHVYTGMLCFIAFCRFCIVHKLKVCDNSASSKSINIIFPTVFTHFVSLCHTLLIFQYFELFIIIISVMVMCVIFDVTTEKRSWLAEASGYGQYFLTRIFF